MNLRYKLAFYLFGLLIGFYFVGEFLSAKAKSKGVEFCYFPNCRVIRDIKNKPFRIDTTVVKTMEKLNITKKNIAEALPNGDVDFDLSNKKYKNGKLYVIDTTIKETQKVRLHIINSTTEAFLEKIQFIK